MPKPTETYAKMLSQTTEGTAKYWDTEIRGLVLFVGKKAKTWYYQRDVGGQTKLVLIGRYPIIGAQAARQTAMGLALEMGRGAGRTIKIGPPTLMAPMDAYLAWPKLRSEAHKRSVRQQFDLHLKDWMRLPLDSISKKMVADRHRSLSNHPSAANHVLKIFRTVWNHARRTYDLPDPPTLAIEWFEERPEGTIIEDLREWRLTVDGLQNPIHRTFYELLLFTGLKKTEALTLEGHNIHADHIHLPTTRNGRSFDLPILPIHHEILKPIQNLNRTWVFSSPKSEIGHMTNPARLPWSKHAHRRTFATVAMEAGVLEEIVGRLLNHTPLSINGQRYMKPSLDALRPAMEAVCVEIERTNATETRLRNY